MACYEVDLTALSDQVQEPYSDRVYTEFMYNYTPADPSEQSTQLATRTQCKVDKLLCMASAVSQMTIQCSKPRSNVSGSLPVKLLW